MNIVNDKFLLRKDVGMDKDGHVGLAISATYILVHNILMTGDMHHELDLNGGRNTVYSRITAPDFTPDFHAQGNKYNLYTEFDMGQGKPSWRDRDNVNGGRKNLQSETFWGLQSRSDFVFLEPADQSVMVGIPNELNTSIGADYHHEAIDPTDLEPGNMYLAQMAATPGKVIPPDVTLSLPPAMNQDKVTIILPTDDTYVGQRESERDINYGFSSRVVVRNSRQEGFIKFDLSGVNIPIVHAKLKIAVKFSIKTSFTLLVNNVTDNSWSEDTLTYNNRPVVDTLIATLPLSQADIPEWSYVFVDVTENVQNVLASGNTFMSLNLQGAIKDQSLAIKAKQSANPVHIVVYLDQSTTSNSEQVTQWSPTDDAYTEKIFSRQSNNYGSSSRIKMRQNRNDGFVKFDITGVDGGAVNPVITSAKLHAFATINLKTAFNLQVRNVTDNSWTEGSLNYLNKPDAYDVVAEVFYDKTILPTWSWIEIDLTDHVQYIHSLGQNVFSLHFQGGGALHPTKDAGLAFRSTEDPNSPYLEVSLIDDVPPAPSTPTGPDQVTGLQGTSGTDSVTLTWNVGTASLSPITYNVYRYDSSGYVIKAMGLITTTYTDYRVATGSANVVFPLSYVVSAVDTAGDESIYSENVTLSLV